MNDFFSVLSFLISPLIVASLFSILLAPLGSSLSIRNETLSALALPSVAGSVLAFIASFGISLNQELLLISLSALAVAIIFSGVLHGVKSLLKRQLILACLFVGGHSLTHLVLSLSPDLESDFSHLLSGEILAIKTADVWRVAIYTFFVLIIAFRFRFFLRSFVLDESILRQHGSVFTKFSWFFQFATAFTITYTVTLLGPLLTTALLVFPAFFADLKKGSLFQYLLYSILMSLISIIGGFSLSILWDIPPAYVTSAFLPIFGILIQISNRFLTKK